MLKLQETLKEFGIILTFYLLLFNFKWFYTKLRMIYLAWKIKGPMNYFFIGAVYLAFKIKNTEDLIKCIQNFHEKYGTLYKIWLGPSLIVSSASVKDLEIILNSDKCVEKSTFYHHVKPFAPDGIGLIRNPIWKENRRIIISTLTHNMIEGSFDKMKSTAELIVQQIEDKLIRDNEDTCFYHLIETRLINLVSENLFGVPQNTKLSANIQKSFTDKAKFVSEHLPKVWTYIDPIFQMTAGGRKRKELVQNFYNTTKEIVKNKRQDIEESKLSNTNSKQFLETLIVQHKLSDYQLHNEIVHFLTASVDSSCTTINYTLMCLGIYPEIQERVYEELVDVIGSNGTLTKEDLPKLEYLQRVIFETMRLFPATQNLSREVSEDVQITENITLPSGSILIISIYGVHMNPDYWPDPWKFDPDRFLPENVSKRHPYSFLTFSGGIRNCLGYKYTKINMKTIISSILLKFRAECGYNNLKDVRHDAKFVNSPVLGYKLRLYQRN